jgi:hypothetical protein
MLILSARITSTNCACFPIFSFFFLFSRMMTRTLLVWKKIENERTTERKTTNKENNYARMCEIETQKRKTKQNENVSLIYFDNYVRSKNVSDWQI